MPFFDLHIKAEKNWIFYVGIASSWASFSTTANFGQNILVAAPVHVSLSKECDRLKLHVACLCFQNTMKILLISLAIFYLLKERFICLIVLVAR